MQLIERDNSRVAHTVERDEWDMFRLEIREAVASLRRHAFGIGMCVLASVALATPVVLMRTPNYVGTAQVLLDPRGLNVVSNELVPQPPSADVNDAVIETQSRFLHFDAVLQEVVQRLRLTEDPAYIAKPGLSARIKGLLGLSSEAQPVDAVDVATKILGKQTTFQREGKSFVVNLSVKANDPVKAARLAAAIGQAFVDDTERRRKEVVVRARDAIGATLKGQSEHVIAAEHAVETYKREIGVVDQDGRSVNSARITDLNSQLLAARAQTRAVASRVAALEGRSPSPGEGAGGDTVESSTLSQLRVNLAEVVRQQDNLRATLGPRHPAAVEVDAQVRSLRAAIARETQRLQSSLRSDLAAARNREDAITRDLARAEADTSKTNTALVTLRQLEREALAQRSVYEKTLGRERELLEQESVGTSNVSLVSASKPDPQSADVQPALVLAAAALLGLLASAAAAVLFDRRGGRLHSAERLTARTGIPVLGILPLSRKRLREASETVAVLAGSRGSSSARILTRLADYLDEAAERGQVRLLIVSASNGPIATIIAQNLVLAQAARGRRALLVDGDARSGRLTWMIPRDPQSGVVSCTVEGYPPFCATAASERTHPDAAPDRDEGYDCVVIDGGEGQDETRLRRSAATATAVVLVAEAGVATSDRIEELRAALLSNAGKIAGALFVVSGADPVVPAPARSRPLPQRFVLTGDKEALA
ncbi:exopolysaccharide transport family protein [Methylobacterium sp. J-076]|uniref:exopolysaccharide transport family protein n=1 Tax=Methylobacterium sp. J-076 TaxID=2836655 RepID=UPI001FBAA6C2|nr:exopolysaccharide transport family protein [Methylobacterium sp. J-076]MCJ2013389.1 exopolysaccharide transport family protein [Methylobacterium sp. J-076]